MAEAILRCLAKSQNMKSVHVYDPNEARMSVLKARYGITPADTPEDATDDAEFVVCIQAKLYALCNCIFNTDIFAFRS